MAQCVSLMVGLSACLLLALGFAVESSHDCAPHLPVHDGEKINPNDAPVASLMRLPRIGLTRARAISACRDSFVRQGRRGPAFARAEDLQQVRGIGPRTAAELRSCLQFDTAVDPGPSTSERVCEK
jgi:DNA uptake protein ComE-like DNA-binding protein